jgi:hypothetical protein
MAGDEGDQHLQRVRMRAKQALEGRVARGCRRVNLEAPARQPDRHAEYDVLKNCQQQDG